jgi:hypothetical protein
MERKQIFPSSHSSLLNWLRQTGNFLQGDSFVLKR